LFIVVAFLITFIYCEIMIAPEGYSVEDRIEMNSLFYLFQNVTSFVTFVLLFLSLCRIRKLIKSYGQLRESSFMMSIHLFIFISMVINNDNFIARNKLASQLN
jgi:hypothetical protein